MNSVLIVEDNEQMRRMIRTIVARLADAVYECGDGSEAFDCYASNRPDCVLMDIALPGTDGITATRLITTAYPSARVVIVTDYGSPRLRQAARQAGAMDYVLKENLGDLETILSRCA